MKRLTDVLARTRSHSVAAIPNVFQVGSLVMVDVAAYSVATPLGHLVSGLLLGFVGYVLDGGEKK
jgi:3D (Asp-Asp-Asp) domain-containing protein